LPLFAPYVDASGSKYKGRSMDGERRRNGGKVRAERLTKEERIEIARTAAAARWEKNDPGRARLPRAMYGADDRPLMIGDMVLPCYVLEDERRVLTAKGMQQSMRIAAGGSMRKGMSRLELFASGKIISPFVSNDLADRVRNPIIFLTTAGARAYGYEAEVLVELCEAVLAARAAGRLQAQQEPIAQQCELIMRGLARVGIVALVDEATGFQEVRKRDALHKILEAYIAPELMPWTKRFPDAFYEEMFRLHGWKYDPTSVKRPGVVGKFTNTFIYDQLPDGVLDQLRVVNPRDGQGRRRARHHQFLTEEVGNPHLEKQILITTTLMRAARSWPQFRNMFDRVFQTKGKQIDLLPDD
jgi:hypothetical protein